MRIVQALVAVTVLVLAAIPAYADITRSCSASVDLWIDDSKGNKAAELGTIEGRGSCQSKLHANDCRARARGEIDQCRHDMWANRQANSIPASCKTLVSNSSRSGARLTYAGIALFEPNRLMARAALAACCRMRPNSDKLTIQIGGRIVGDKKCAATKIGNDRYQEEYAFPRYEMSCKAWRDQGLCGN